MFVRVVVLGEGFRLVFVVVLCGLGGVWYRGDFVV